MKSYQKRYLQWTLLESLCQMSIWILRWNILNTTSPRLSIHAQQLQQCISHGPMISRRHANGIRPCRSKVGPDQKTMDSGYVRNINLWKRDEAVKQWSFSYEDVQNKSLLHVPWYMSSLNELPTAQSLSEGRKWCDASPRHCGRQNISVVGGCGRHEFPIFLPKCHWFQSVSWKSSGRQLSGKAPDFILAPSSTRFWSPRTSHSKQGQSVVGFRLRSIPKTKHIKCYIPKNAVYLFIYIYMYLNIALV